jgi:hypothetical protein
MRKLGLLFGIIFVAAALAGCGGGGSSSSGDSATAGGGGSQKGAEAAKTVDDQTGEGSKASNPAAARAEAQMRRVIQRDVDAKLTAWGRPQAEIDCVNQNIATMTGEEMAGGVVTPSDAASDSEDPVAAYLAGLADGCS